MIDYNKLKEAHELAQKLSKKEDIRVDVNVNFYKKIPCDFELVIYDKDPDLDCDIDTFGIIDPIISRLHKLTQPQPKYRESQRVWFMDCTRRDGIIGDGIIERQEYKGSFFGEPQYSATIGDFTIPVDCLYPTREALIDAQIVYWQTLKWQSAANENCLHEDDGNCYTTQPSQTKCKKCGEFYK